MAVDTDNNVITHISAEHASKKDSRLLLDVTESTLDRLESFGLSTSTILAHAGFSSGENYFTLNHWGLNSYIPIHGGLKKNVRDLNTIIVEIIILVLKVKNCSSNTMVKLVDI
jgi:hypothetical protein